MIYFVTGHRPDKLGGYSEQNFKKLENFAIHIFTNRILPDKIITGMALGWDQAVASACIKLSIPFDAYIPCPLQEKLWHIEDKIRYNELLKHASKQVLVSDKYHPGCMQVRNIAMAKNGGECIALYNFGPSGGTYNMIKYCNKKHIKIHNFWIEYLSWRIK